MSSLQRRRTQVLSKEVKSTDRGHYRQTNASLAKRSERQVSHSQQPELTDDLQESYQHKAEIIIMKLQYTVKFYEDQPEAAKKQWLEQCGRFVECRGLNLKSIHPVGEMLKKNGLFFVCYARLQKILFPDQDHERLRKELSEKHASSVVKNLLEFRRFFGLPKDSESQSHAQMKPKPRSLFGDSRTPPKKPELPLKNTGAIPREVSGDRSAVNLKRNPMDDANRMASVSRRKSIPFKEYAKMVGIKLDDEPPCTSSNKKSPMFVGLPHYVPLSEREAEIMNQVGLVVAYDDKMVNFFRILTPNFKNRNIFGVCLVIRKFIHKHQPVHAIVNLRDFEMATEEDLEDMREQHIKIFYKVDQHHFDQYCVQNQASSK